MRIKNDDAGAVFKEFQKTYPTLSKEAVHFHPTNLLTIVVYLKDGTKLSFDYEQGRAVKLNERWKK